MEIKKFVCESLLEAQQALAYWGDQYVMLVKYAGKDAGVLDAIFEVRELIAHFDREVKRLKG